MKRLLISTTALSVALMQINPAALMAQTMTEDGSIIADDGSVLCLGTAEAPCDMNAVMEGLAAQEAEAAGAAEAEAEALRQAEEEAAAQAEAEAQAEAQRAADEAAAAEAEAQRAADEAAAAEEAQRAADEAAAAEEAQRAADEAAAAEEPAAEEPVVEEPAAEEPAVEEPAAEKPVAEEPVVEEPVVEEPVVEEPAVEEPAAEEPAAEEPVVEEPVVEEPAAEEPAVEEPVVEEPAVEEPAGDGAVMEVPALETPAVEDPAAAELVGEPVDAPAPSETAVEQLTTLLAQPDAVDPAALEAAATLAPVATTDGEPVVIPQSEAAENVLVTRITEETARSSAEEFAAAPTAVATASGGRKRSGLTDLEKVGLVALGALVVGAVITNARQNSRDEVVSNSGDRVVVRRGSGDYVVYKDDDALLRRPGSTVRTESFRDGSTRTIVERGDGTQVVTIRDVTGRVLRRATYDGFGREVILIDDLAPERVIDVTTLPVPRARVISMSTSEEDALLKARMAALDAQEIGRSFSLRQVREIREVRQLAATVDVNNITFDSGSSAIQSTQAESLAALGRFLAQMVEDNPNEVFLIEGHTDAVGSAASNLALSDRRAESVALALTEYFDVPPENMVVQGYGEGELRVATEANERQNRRVAVRIVTPLLRSASASLE